MRIIRQSRIEQLENTLSAGRRGLLGTGKSKSSTAHGKHLRNTGSGPRTDNSSRIRLYSLEGGNGVRLVTPLTMTSANAGSTSRIDAENPCPVISIPVGRPSWVAAGLRAGTVRSNHAPKYFAPTPSYEITTRSISPTYFRFRSLS